MLTLGTISDSMTWLATPETQITASPANTLVVFAIFLSLAMDRNGTAGTDLPEPVPDKYSGVFCRTEFFLKLNNKPNGKLDYDQYKNDLVHWVQRVVTTFDYTTKGILGTVVGDTRFYLLKDYKGNPPGMIGRLPQNAVTFIDNHDTYSQQQCPFSTNPNDKATQGYAYILTHPGIPSARGRRVRPEDLAGRAKVLDGLLFLFP
ncbi:hypothetical protein T459_09408 [Capsicum annuum]|uniref:1,4-alpha-D-glucan glucanohydrolase n=1 Tax=Capsicum annuum TaxID=4072 RepID=A0A2G2ZZ93_CAPAN|nr:hypothetical protein T459_09408 [Capsicum annuum]